jgi:hypothetical protein
MSKNFQRTIPHVAAILVVAVLIGLIIPWIQPAGKFGNAFLSTFLLSGLILSVLYVIWHEAGGGRQLLWLMITAFFLRLVLGVFFAWGLPRFGYEEEVQLSGYFFADAFTRDGYAWQLASSGESLLKAFGNEFMADQYGGLLALSALVYRVFSPDTHRPLLMVIVSAGAAAAGIPFLLSAARKRFGSRVAWISAWILALYPESLILGASQMREPFLITLFAISFWSMLRGLDRQINWKTIAGMIVGVLGLALISFRVAIPVLGVLLIWACLEWHSRITQKKSLIIFWVAVGLSLIGIVTVSWGWLRSAMHWDLVQTYVASGWMQYLFENLPLWVRTPFIIIYGIFQPLLPAAIADPAPWIWRVVGILRGAGWFAILPFLAYTGFRVWKIGDKNKKRLLMWLIFAVWGWILLASIRAGGDQWDNPRYRTIFLPWMSIAAAWGIVWAREQKDRWLGRLLIVEGIFLLFFTHWYLGRYYNIFSKLPFWQMIALILILSLAVVAGGWFWDRSQKKKKDQPPEVGQ